MRIVFVVGLALVGLGAWRGLETSLFISRAVQVGATVDSVQELPGPPKPRQKVPLHLSYVTPDGGTHRGVTHMPMLQRIEAGDTIRVLVDPGNPQDVRLPLWSEQWSGPSTYVIGGLLLTAMGALLKNRSRVVR